MPSWRKVIQTTLLQMLFATSLCSVVWGLENSSEVHSSRFQSNSSSMKKDFKGYLRFEAFNYPTELPDQKRLSQSHLVSTQFQADFRSQRMHNRFDVTVAKDVYLGASTLSVSEIFASAKLPTQTKQDISVGRRKEFWSQLDQEWQLGLWQPNGLVDALRPEDQGLTGVFYQAQTDRVSFLAYVSPIFIPSMGPEIKEKGGSLESDSRWYRVPSSSFPLFGKETKLVYSLDIPEINELISKPGSGMRFKVGGDQPGVWMSANYAYKPVNALLLKYKTSLYLPEQDPSTGEVSISPSVGYHQLYGADVGYVTHNGQFSVSYLEDKPDRHLPKDNWVLQQLDAMKAVAFNYQTNVNMNYFSQPLAFNFNYLRLWGGAIRDFDASGVEQGAIFEHRFNFTHAASVQIDINTDILHKPFVSRFKYMREFDQKGMLLNTEFNYYPTRSVAVVLGADVLGVDPENENDTEGRFLNQYRANDRVYGGLSYVF